MFHETFTFPYVRSSGLPYYVNEKFSYPKVPQIRYMLHDSSEYLNKKTNSVASSSQANYTD
jgi:hypothetical protein